MSYRNINKDEIATLVQQGCLADDWSQVSVKEGFNPLSVCNSQFSGDIKLGVFNNKMELEKGVLKSTGVYHSFIQNCVIDDNCLISNVRTLANYHIKKNVVIDNVGSMLVTGQSTFGNGTEINVLNEGGGRGLAIYDKLTAQIAYFMVMYRHDFEMIEAIKKLIENYVSSKKSYIGRVENNTQISNTVTIKNVNFGEFAKVDGAYLLENGSICSTSFAPTNIGHGVSAKNFIIHSGSIVEESALVLNCFVGQGVQIGKQFSAENSVFFANCEAFHSEACSVFAGPYTVTHHKSTLLIAGLFSFYNAGSGTNQSNHMYKIGPVHQGVLERGSKTGSYSYLLWPSRTGAYSVIIGKHYANFDSSELPFSFINEHDGKTKLTPAFNLCSVGTKRDSMKWPKRDRRNDRERLDLINFELYNPYIISKIIAGTKVLKQLNEKAKKDQEYIIYKGVIIFNLMIKTALSYYEMATKIYIGNEILYKLGDFYNLNSIETVRVKLNSHPEEYFEKWIDASGMIVPLKKVEAILESVKSCEVNSVTSLSESLQTEFLNYRKYAWSWCANLINQFTGFDINNVTTAQLIQIIKDWKLNATRLNNLILKDAEKEFNANSHVGYGIDGGDETKDKDFEMVRGTFNNNHFIIEVMDENVEIARKADDLIEILQKMK